jgi:hypothetical protein
MRRRYFFAVTLLSAVLGASTVWWWMHSGTRMNQLTFKQSSGDTVRIVGCDGKLLLTRTMTPPGKGDDADYQPTELSWVTVPYTPGADKSQPELKWASFHYSHDMASKGVIESSFVLPVWVLTAVFAVVPLIWFQKKLKLMRKLAA